MDAPRDRYDDGRHDLPGPHQGLPAGFVPLRLRWLPRRTAVTVASLQALVGRHSKAAVRLADPEVSRQHCRLSFEHGQWRVSDLHSLNGVYVNGERRTEAVLYEGDELRLGRSVALVESGTPVRFVRTDTAEHEVIKQIAENLSAEA